jgi:hypothetical protein
MSRTCLLPLALLVVLAGCGGGGGDALKRAKSTPEAAARAVSAQAPAAPAAGALAQIPTGPQVERRLGYANLDALASAKLPVARARVLRTVLGEGAGRVGNAGSAVQVADATVIHGDGAPRVLGASGELADVLAQTAPQTSAITPPAPSAAQSCLGDTLAQTILGPRTMGRDAALGVGLAESGDAPAGIQLRICGAPRLIRDLHAMEKELDERFGKLGANAVIEEREIGEREIVTGTLSAGAIPPQTLLQLLSGGASLRSLAWR